MVSGGPRIQPDSESWHDGADVALNVLEVVLGALIVTSVLLDVFSRS